MLLCAAIGGGILFSKNAARSAKPEAAASGQQKEEKSILFEIFNAAEEPEPGTEIGVMGTVENITELVTDAAASSAPDALEKNESETSARSAEVTTAKTTTKKQTAKTTTKKQQSYKVGSYVTFGKYEQKNNGGSEEPIEWLVLANDGSKALLISRYALDAKAYNDEDVDITWENCDLRRWLNGTFYNSAFSAEEKAKIRTTRLENSHRRWNDDTQEFYMTYDNETDDKVFLLSYKEAEQYFTSAKARICAPTPYAIARGVWTDSDFTTASGEAACCWWLRTRPTDGVNYIYSDGYINISNYLDYTNNGVRPAFWVNL